MSICGVIWSIVIGIHLDPAVPAACSNVQESHDCRVHGKISCTICEVCVYGVIGYIVNETKSQAFSENNYELLMFVRMFVLKEK